jgi:hypothetical protein
LTSFQQDLGGRRVSRGASLRSCTVRRRVDPARPVPIRLYLLGKQRKKLVSHGSESDINRLRRVRGKICYAVDSGRCRTPVMMTTLSGSGFLSRVYQVDTGQPRIRWFDGSRFQMFYSLFSTDQSFPTSYFLSSLVVNNRSEVANRCCMAVPSVASEA